MGGLLLAGLLLGVIVILSKGGKASVAPPPLSLPSPKPFPPPLSTVPSSSLPGVPLPPGRDFPSRPTGLSSPATLADVPKEVQTAVEAINNGKAVTPEVIMPAIDAAQDAGLPETAQKLAQALDQQMTTVIPALVAAPDLPATPDVDGKTGKPLWFLDTRGGLKMAIPNFTSSLATFKALQDVIGVKTDGRIGPGTLKVFQAKMKALGFERFPQDVGQLAANAVKYTEVIKKHFTPGQVGRPFDVPSRKWREFVARVNADWDKLTPAIQEKFAAYIGQEVDGQTITLSGLCGLVSRAGMRGAESWLKRESDREKYPATTRAFQQTNGLF